MLALPFLWQWLFLPLHGLYIRLHNHPIMAKWNQIGEGALALWVHRVRLLGIHIGENYTYHCFPMGACAPTN